MKFNLKITQVYIVILLAISTFSFGQQMEIEYDSSPNQEPHILLQEVNDPDDWARLWFKNINDPNHRWAFLAKPSENSYDADGILKEPIIVAYDGVQIFGISSDGTIRVNKNYTIPGEKGLPGQVLELDANDNLVWVTPTGGNSNMLIDADEDTKVYLSEAAQDSILFEIDGENRVLEITDNKLDAQRRIVVNSEGSLLNAQLTLVDSRLNGRTRMYMRNSNNTDAWALSALADTGSDRDFSIDYNGIPKLEYSLTDHLLSADGGAYLTRDVNDFSSTFELNHPDDEYARMTFSNGGNTNFRFGIKADPSGNGSSDPAKMVFNWFTMANPDIPLDFLELVAAATPFVNVNTNAQFNGNIDVGTAPAAIDTRVSIFTDDNVYATAIKNETTINQNSYAILSTADGTGDGHRYGVYANAEKSNTNGSSYGVYGLASGGNFKYGVYGQAPTANGFGVFCNGNMNYTGTLTNVSDRRFKKNIKSLDNSMLDKVLQVEATSYEYDGAKYPTMQLAEGKQYGFIAQQLQTIFPELVNENIPVENPDNGQVETMMGVDYTKMIPILTKAIQEQQTMIEALQNQVKLLSESK